MERHGTPSGNRYSRQWCRLDRGAMVKVDLANHEQLRNGLAAINSVRRAWSILMTLLRFQ